jgi:uncharacterized membrane protein
MTTTFPGREWRPDFIDLGAGLAVLTQAAATVATASRDPSAGMSIGGPELQILLPGLTAAGAIAYVVLGWAAARPATPEGVLRGLAVGRLALALTLALASGVGIASAAGRFHPHAHALLGVSKAAAVSVAVLLAAFGTILGKVRQNRLVGVQTPWTQRSPLAWEKSNRLLGRFYFWGGLVLLIAAPSTSGAILLGAAATLALLGALAAVLESHRVWGRTRD